MKQATTVLIAAGALLVGGIATAAYMNNRGDAPDPVAVTAPALGGDTPSSEVLPETPALEFAEVLGVTPVTEKEQRYATVIGSEAVREASSHTVPHEVCEDVVVQERLPERDGNVGGTVAGAVIGGLLGNQVGGGSGKKAATAAGAIAGGVIGNKVDQRHVGGRVVTRTEQQCRTENVTSESSRVVGYNVTYRNADGTTGSMRMDRKPGDRIALGSQDKVVGYDVAYRYDGQEGTLRLDEEPASDRLPVVDGKIVTATTAVEVGGQTASRQ